MSNKGKKAATSAANQEIPLMILTNDRTPMKANMLLMLYKAASIGQLAYMDGMDPDTGEIDQLIVGLEPTPDGKFNVFPLAKIFNKVDAIPQYLVPDGQGSYIDYRLPDIAEPPAIGGVEPDVGIPALESIPETESEREEDRPASESGPSDNSDGGTLGGSVDPAVQ